MNRNCDVCSKNYNADERNIKRGWGLCCSKSCAAKKREKSKPGYNLDRVNANNFRRETWNLTHKRTSEGYKIINGVAYDEYDEAVYTVQPWHDEHPFSEDAFNQ